LQAILTVSNQNIEDIRINSCTLFHLKADNMESSEVLSVFHQLHTLDLWSFSECYARD